jgi:hypothetical protein
MATVTTNQVAQGATGYHVEIHTAGKITIHCFKEDEFTKAQEDFNAAKVKIIKRSHSLTLRAIVPYIDPYNTLRRTQVIDMIEYRADPPSNPTPLVEGE